MRVLMITPDFPVDKGGIQSLAGGLAAHLDVELEVVTRVRSASGSEAGPSVPVHRSPEPFGSQQLSLATLNLAGVGHALARAPDVILNLHVNTGPAAALATGLRRVPFVQYLHAQEIPVRPSLTRFAVRRAAATIAVSSHARALAAGIGCDPDPFRVIPPGIDIPDRGGRNVAGDRPTVLTIARFEVAYKGHDMMVEAMPSILARVPDAQWVLIGEGPLRIGIEQRVEELGIGNSVSFLGRVSDAERDRRLREAHVFAMPSRLPEDGTGEGFGIVFLEAAAHGLPVVAGNVGGALESVVDGRTGMLVDPLNPNEIGEAVSGLLLDRERAESLGAAGMEWASRFAWPRIAADVNELLVAVAQRSR